MTTTNEAIEKLAGEKLFLRWRTKWGWKDSEQLVTFPAVKNIDDVVKVASELMADILSDGYSIDEEWFIQVYANDSGRVCSLTYHPNKNAFSLGAIDYYFR